MHTYTYIDTGISVHNYLDTIIHYILNYTVNNYYTLISDVINNRECHNELLVIDHLGFFSTPLNHV